MLLAWALIALPASPILWLIHSQDVGHISWLQPPSWLELYHLGVFLAADGGKAVGAVLLVLELVLVGLFITVLGKAWRDGNADLTRWRYTVIVSMVFTPVILALLVSIVRPAFYHRFLIICLPGWLLMVSSGVLQLRTRAWRIGAIVAVCLLSLTTTGLFYVRQTEDWRGAVAYLIANKRAEDRVLYYESVGQFAGESYREWLQPPNTPRPVSVGIQAANTGWERDLDSPARVWLVVYRAKPDDTESLAVQHELTTHYEARGEKKFSGVTIIEYNAR